MIDKTFHRTIMLFAQEKVESPGNTPKAGHGHRAEHLANVDTCGKPAERKAAQRY